MGFSQPSYNARPTRPARCATSKSKSEGFTTVSSTTKICLTDPLMATLRTMGECPISTFLWATKSTVLPSGSNGWMTAESPVTTMAKALMSPLTLSICMRKLTQLGMAKKTLSSHSLPGSAPSSSGLAAILCTCSMKSKTLMTRGWLGRSPASASLTKRPLNLPCKSKSCTKNLMWPVRHEPCLRNDWSSPVQPRRWPNLRTSRRRLACCPHTLVTRTTIDKNVSSNQRVMLLALRMPGGYRLPRLM